MKSHYKKLFIIAALLVAPVAFAEDNTGTPPHPQLFPSFDSNHEREGDSTTTPRMPIILRSGHMEGSTTLELHGMLMPPPPHTASSTKPGDGIGWGWGFDHGDGRPATTSSTTTPDGRPLPPQARMMGSSTRHEIDMGHGTSTPEHPGGGILARIFNFFSGGHDNGSSTPPRPPHIDGSQDASSTAATSTDQQRQPPQAVIEFLQNFFGRFFH